MTRQTVLRLPLLLGLLAALACNKPPPEKVATPAERSEANTTPADKAPLAPNPTESKALASLPSFAPLVDAVKAAVINVEVRAVTNEPRQVSGPRSPFDFFDRFFGQWGAIDLRRANRFARDSVPASSSMP